MPLQFRYRRQAARPFGALRVRALCAALALSGLVAACASPPPVITPPPPAPPSIALSPKLIELAGAYRHYMARTSAIAPDFANGDAIAGSLKVGAAYEPGQMVRGAIAYGAVAALQDKGFVEGVRKYVGDPVQRRQVAYELMKDPAYAVGLQGSAGAAGLVKAAIGGEGQQLYDRGKAVKQSAYDIQRQPWSRGEVQSREARLADAKSLSAAVMAGDVDETARLQQASMGVASLGLAGDSAAPPYTPLVVRSLAVAALAALGEAGDANVETILALAIEPNVGSCMNMSKLNLYQCLAVARPHYEDVFCLGQHAMMDTGRCMIRAAGMPEPFEARFIPDAKSVNRSMVVPKPPVKKKTKS